MTSINPNKHESMARFQDQILLRAILTVEENDYLGLLIEKAKMIISRGGLPFNNESANEILRDLLLTIDECKKYRKLNSILGPKVSAFHFLDFHQMDNYFKLRIRTAKLILRKLSAYCPDQHNPTLNTRS